MATGSDLQFGESDVLSRTLLEGKTRIELVAFAKDLKVPVPSGTRKADVLASILKWLSDRDLLEKPDTTTDSEELVTMSEGQGPLVESAGGGAQEGVDEEEPEVEGSPTPSENLGQIEHASGGDRRDPVAGLGLAVRITEAELEMKRLELKAGEQVLQIEAIKLQQQHKELELLQMRARLETDNTVASRSRRVNYANNEQRSESESRPPNFDVGKHIFVSAPVQGT